ncbi:hypothetical protein JB92DRAFT_3126440 [Gautieria morchelliformis]|nr:hypothetical protein JB92DRAFT_3126440 [Gautieria morchelliformis]
MEPIQRKYEPKTLALFGVNSLVANLTLTVTTNGGKYGIIYIGVLDGLEDIIARQPFDRVVWYYHDFDSKVTAKDICKQSKERKEMKLWALQASEGTAADQDQQDKIDAHTTPPSCAMTEKVSGDTLFSISSSDTTPSSDSISDSASGSDSISASAFGNDSASGRTSTSSVRLASSTPISDFRPGTVSEIKRLA